MWLVLLISMNAMALVSQPRPLSPNEQAIDVRFTREGGVMKPSRNSESFQTANTLIAQLGYRWSPQKSSLKDLTYLVEYRTINTPLEKKEGITFHEDNQGHQVSIGLSFNLVHESNYNLGVFVKASPFVDVDEEKFANPRVDFAQTGWSGGFGLSDRMFFESTLLYGSGIPKEQNMYVAMNQLLGYRRWGGITKLGPYLEADLESRSDRRYSREFSAGGSKEKIQLYKVGVLIEHSRLLSQHSSIGVSYLQKIFGQYLPSTNAASASYTRFF